MKRSFVPVKVEAVSCPEVVAIWAWVTTKVETSNSVAVGLPWNVHAVAGMVHAEPVAANDRTVLAAASAEVYSRSEM